MKNTTLFAILMTTISLSTSCSKTEDSSALSGDPSPMAAVGVTVSSSSAAIAGVSNFSAAVTSNADGVSSYTAQATVTNTLLKNMVANYPGITVTGNTVKATDFKIQQTKDGIKCVTGGGAGMIVNYNSNVGDTYPVGSTGRTRKVVSKTGVDDYPYGLFLIKTVQVEADANTFVNTGGVKNITYIANHKYGLVGVKVNFDDGTTSTFPIYTSTTN